MADDNYTHARLKGRLGTSGPRPRPLHLQAGRVLVLSYAEKLHQTARRGCCYLVSDTPRRMWRPSWLGLGSEGFLTHLLFFGFSGVGKTTLIQKASEVLQSSGVPVDGFYTQEVRQGGRRIGFDVVTLSGARGPLSRVGSQPPPGKPECRVGQYVVDLASFEQLALPALRNAGPSCGPGYRVCIVDEIGKMELFSQPFIQAVRQTLSAPGTVVLGTIPVPKGKPLALVEEIRNRRDVKVFNVTKENRNGLLPDIVTCVQSSQA
ncbi:cancer-related nucleoside-triphosphatase [Acomys russatus]|uniref:cancer-related nucleoside-triphosphatase n=1 Tax=Acomys russatus TaxID=60746 RepID=UPI0021E33B13|nr:cancer-related nucleoside-triphosphatase [Acomys russatus]